MVYFTLQLELQFHIHRGSIFQGGSIFQAGPNMEKKTSKQKSTARLISELVKSFKARSMYPAGHPARAKFLGQLLKSIETFLENSNSLEVTVTKEGIQADGEEIKTSDAAHSYLAEECFARQIRHLILHKGFVGKDLDALFSLLAEEPEQIRADGGASDYIRTRTTGALLVEEIDYSGILEKRVETTSDKRSGYSVESHALKAPPSGHTDEQPVSPTVFDDPGTPELSQEEILTAKLDDLDQATQLQDYRNTLVDIRESLRASDIMDLDRYAVIVLRHLGKHLGSKRPEEALSMTRETVREFARPDLMETLAGELAKRSTADRNAIIDVLKSIHEVSIPALLKRLTEEEVAFGRKTILTTLGQFGEATRPYLYDWLDDERWYVLRNAIDLLSNVGGSDDSARIISCLEHKNSQVRLSALRFLTRHPIDVPDDKIQALLNDADREIRSRMIYALGVLRGRRALDQLLELAKKPAFGEGDVHTRENAVKGIGRVGGDDSVGFLKGLLDKRGIIDRESHEKIHKAAVEALIVIGGPSAAVVLNAVLENLKGDSRRLAEDHLRKSSRE